MAQHMQILDNALDAVGKTPLIRLDKIAQSHGLKCNLLGKAEFMSVGGSVKDRIAKAMVEAAEKDGILIPGQSVVIEPTSGNTGVARRLEKEIPGGVILDQYRNVNNPLAHEWTTGPEIIDAIVSTPSTPARPSSGKVDAIVAGAGTGGTVTGLSRAVRKHNKDCIVVGIDPKGSILALPEALNVEGAGSSYVVEGIGYDFIPDVLVQKEVDAWLKTEDDESFLAVQQLMRKEGLLVGGSSGSALSGALRWLKTEEGSKVASTPGANVVVVLPDGVRNYMSKPWFLKIAMESEPTPLREIIGKILQKEVPAEHNAPVPDVSTLSLKEHDLARL